MAVMTIHAEDYLVDAVRAYANEVGKSVNRSATELLESALGLVKRPRRRRDFSEFCGILRKGEADEIRAKMKSCEKIDRELWS